MPSPIFGPEIQCPHCRQTVPALTPIGTYSCPRHGAFESDPLTYELIHISSGRRWRLWNNEWYRQHTHPDEIRFEILEALDRLYTQGYRPTRLLIARRYQELISRYTQERRTPSQGQEVPSKPRLFGVPVEFSPDPKEEPCWEVINFHLEKEPGVPVRYPYFRVFE